MYIYIYIYIYTINNFSLQYFPYNIQHISSRSYNNIVFRVSIFKRNLKNPDSIKESFYYFYTKIFLDAHLCTKHNFDDKLINIQFI